MSKPNLSFNDAQRWLNGALLKRVPSLYTDRIAPLLCVINDGLSQEIRQMQSLLVIASEGIVNDFWDNREYQKTLNLSEDLFTMLSQIKHPYQIGCLRTDFILDIQSRPRICEINARFISNGIILGQRFSEIIREQTQLPSNIQFVDLPDIEVQLSGGNPSVILKGREPGMDIHWLLQHFESLGFKDLLKNPFIDSMNWNQKFNNSVQIILELHQDEILSLPESAKISLAGSKTRNDLRTIFIVHDKRFLSLLSQKVILERYLSEADAQFLADRIAPTYLNLECASSEESWVVKPAIGGKSEGVKLFHSKQSLEQYLKNLELPQVIQGYVEQVRMNLALESGVVREYFGVGSSVSIDRQVLGPGIFRISENPICSIANGGWVLPSATGPNMNDALSFLTLSPKTF